MTIVLTFVHSSIELFQTELARVILDYVGKLKNAYDGFVSLSMF